MAQKVWMITGASRGLGAEVAKAALAAGEKVIATGRGRDGLDFSSDKDALFPVEMDVTNETQVTAGVRDGVSRYGRIDVLVNNAGFGMLGAIEETPAEDVERIYRTNVFGLLNVIRAVLPTMRQQKAGHIINFSSLGGFRASAGWGVYCSTKFAVEGITEAPHDERTSASRNPRYSGRARLFPNRLHGQPLARRHRTADCGLCRNGWKDPAFRGREKSPAAGRSGQICSSNPATRECPEPAPATASGKRRPATHHR